METTASTPRQPNGYDCGVYCIFFADHLLQGTPLPTGHTSLEEYRKWITLALLQGRFPPLDPPV